MTKTTRKKKIVIELRFLRVRVHDGRAKVWRQEQLSRRQSAYSKWSFETSKFAPVSLLHLIILK